MSRICVLCAMLAVASGCEPKPEPPCEVAWYVDDDEDGHGDAGFVEIACEAPAGHVALGDDCDDLDGSVYPGAPEQCNGRDDNCNDEADEDLTFSTWYPDLDHDGYGVDDSSVVDCEAPLNHVDRGGDCDDKNADAWPGAPEPCVPVDLNCDGDADMARIDGAGYPTLGEALDAAVDGDEIEVCVADHRDTLTHTGGAVTLRGTTGDPADVVLDGRGSHRILSFEGSGLRVEALTFLEGHATDGGGGAIQATTSSLEIVDCVFEGNRADLGEGGAVQFSGGGSSTVVVQGSSFIDNGTRATNIEEITYTFDGGALAATASEGAGLTVTVEGSTFQDNHASASGGAIHVWPQYNCALAVGLSTVTLDDTTFDGNVAADDGGAAYLGLHDAYLVAGSFIDNNSGGLGGAVAFGREDRCSEEITDRLQITGTELVGNYTETVGGAVLAQLVGDGVDLIVDVSDALFERNTGVVQGGGIGMIVDGVGAGATLNLTDVAMSENIAVWGGGGFFFDVLGEQVATVDATITTSTFERNDGGWGGGVAMILPTNAILALESVNSNWGVDADDNLPDDVHIGFDGSWDFDLGASFTCDVSVCM